MNRVGVKPSSLLSAQLPLFSYPVIPSNIILPSTSNILYKSTAKCAPYCCLIILMLGLSMLYNFALFFVSHQHSVQTKL